MKFTKIRKRNVYETWFHKNRNTGLISYIFHLPNGDYHFYVSCFKKRCGLDQCKKDDCDMYISYNSLNHGLQYETFEECREAVIKWHKDRE